MCYRLRTGTRIAQLKIDDSSIPNLRTKYCYTNIDMNQYHPQTRAQTVCIYTEIALKNY